MAAQVDSKRINKAADEDSILTFDVSDDALERAGGAATQIITIGYCTHYWFHCDVPQ